MKKIEFYGQQFSLACTLHRRRKVLNMGRRGGGGGQARFRILGGQGGANFLLAVN